MKLILSPTKTMVSTTVDHGFSMGLPLFENQAKELIQTLTPLNTQELKKLFKTSDNLTLKTHEQIHGFDTANAGPAISMFQGEAFKTLSAKDFSSTQLDFANTHLLIFSGLYGVLRPLDRIKPYRLDFNTPLRMNNKSLKHFWQKTLVDYFESILTPNEYILNLASDEYSSILNCDSIKNRMIRFQFREKVNGSLKNLSVRAKQARGLFARKIVMDQLLTPDDLKQVCLDGYTFSKEFSSPLEWFFIR